MEKVNNANRKNGKNIKDVEEHIGWLRSCNTKRPEVILRLLNKWNKVANNLRINKK